MQVSRILLAAIFGYFLQQPVIVSGVSNCYSCSGTCNEPLQERACDPNSPDWLCVSATQGNYTAKGCVPNNSSVVEECNTINQQLDGYCYLCNTDLCNRKNKKSGATKCYSCLGDCQLPWGIEECPESDTAVYMCRQSQITINNVVYERRGCAADIEDVRNICDNLEKSDVGSCLMCPDDLCNAFLGTKATQCYTCEGYCDSLSVENCPDDGDRYICMAFKSAIGNTTVERRGCYLAYVDTIEACKKSNELNNGSCYTCEKDLCNAL